MSTKAEVARKLAKKRHLSRSESHQAVDLVLDSIKEALLRGEKVSLVGFGSFDLRLKKGRKGRNPRTNESITIPPKAVAYFKPGKSFRETVLNADLSGQTLAEDKGSE